MQNSTAAWASRNLAAYSPAVATRALSRVSTERSRSNGNTQSFRDLRLAISASASGRLLYRQTRSKIADIEEILVVVPLLSNRETNGQAVLRWRQRAGCIGRIGTGRVFQSIQVQPELPGLVQALIWK